MPTKPIDYSNTSIYKLCCNDPSITDIYVGHTTNFTRRKNEHKRTCTNEDTKAYNFYVYQFIRSNGGWNNWDMIEICRQSCIDGNDARKLERKYFEELGATLNVEVPSRTKTEYYKDNREDTLEYHKIYYEEHKEEINEKDKHRYETHKEEIKEKSRQYRELHKEEINERRRLQYQQKKLKDNV